MDGQHCKGVEALIHRVSSDSIDLPFVNISLTASIAANCESQILVGTSLSDAVKKCMAWVILYYYVM